MNGQVVNEKELEIKEYIKENKLDIVRVVKLNKLTKGIRSDLICPERYMTEKEGKRRQRGIGPLSKRQNFQEILIDGPFKLFNGKRNCTKGLHSGVDNLHTSSMTNTSQGALSRMPYVVENDNRLYQNACLWHVC